jgi:hypothetical protein
VRARIKVKAARNAQFLKRESDSATSSFPSVDPLGGSYIPPTRAGASPVGRLGRRA